MDWLGTGLDGPLIVVRAMHFAATAVVAGGLIFRTFVAEPALRATQAAMTAVVRSQILLVVGIGLAVAAASGVIWLQLQAASMSGMSLGEAMTTDTLLTVLNETQFGLVSKFRTILAVILAVCLASDRHVLARWLALGSALGLITAIAWTGHAGSTVGEIGNLHLASDALHLIAAAAWIGGLVSLALLVAAARRNHLVWAALTRDAARRFSTLGIVSVATLLITGIFNAWILVGSFHALVVTQYGLFLLLKILLFTVMLAFAAVNRLWLTPQLAISSENDTLRKTLGHLTRNSVIEIVLGLTIFGIVGALGTLHPAIHSL